MIFDKYMYSFFEREATVYSENSSICVMSLDKSGKKFSFFDVDLDS
jgi:hypothetical protein